MSPAHLLLCLLLLLLGPVRADREIKQSRQAVSNLKVAFQQQQQFGLNEEYNAVGNQWNSVRDRHKAVVLWAVDSSSADDYEEQQCYVEYTSESTIGIKSYTDDIVVWSWSDESATKSSQEIEIGEAEVSVNVKKKRRLVKANRLAALDALSIARLTCTNANAKANASVLPQALACGVLLTEVAWMTIINGAYSDSVLRLSVLLRLGSRADALQVENIRLQLRAASHTPFFFEPTSVERNASASDVLLTFDIADSLHQRLGERVAATAYAISGCRNYSVNTTTFELPRANDALLLFISHSALHVARNNVELVRLNLTTQTRQSRLVDLHFLYHQRLVFVSDDRARLYKVQISRSGATLLKYRDLTHSCVANHLGVDWLRNEIYYVACNQMWLCNLELECSVVHVFDTAPDRILLHPINGYIFYSAEGKLHKLNWNATSRSAISDEYLPNVDNVVSFHLLDGVSSVLLYWGGVALRQVDLSTNEQVEIDSTLGCCDDFIMQNSTTDGMYILCNGTMRTGDLAIAVPGFNSIVVRAFALFSKRFQPEPRVQDALEISSVVFLTGSVYLNWSYAAHGAADRVGALRWLPTVFELRIELCDVEQRVVGVQLVQGFQTTVHDLTPNRQYRIAVQSITAADDWVPQRAVVRGRTRSPALHALLLQCASRGALEYRLFDASLFSRKLQYLPLQTWPFCSQPPLPFVEFALLDNHLVVLHEESSLLVYEMHRSCYSPITLVNSVSSFAVDVLTDTVYVTNGSSIQRFNLYSPNTTRRTLPLDNFEDVDKVLLHPQSALLCWNARNRTNSFIWCSRLDASGLVLVHVSQSPIKLISFDSAIQYNANSIPLYWFADNETKLYKADLQVSRNRIVVDSITMLLNFTYSLSIQFANAVVRDSLLFWNDRGTLRYLDLELSIVIDSLVNQVDVSCHGSAIRAFSLSEAPFSDEERVRIKRQLMPQLLTKEQVFVQSIDDRTVSVSWVAQNIPCTYMVHCDRSKEVKTETNSVTVRPSELTPMLRCSIVASTFWLDTTVIDAQFEVIFPNRTLVSSLTPFVYYRCDESTKGIPKMRMAVAWHVPQSVEPVLRNFTIATKSCANCSELIQVFKSTLTEYSVWSEDEVQPTCGNLSCALKLHMVTITDKHRPLKCFRIGVCSSYRCDFQQAWCTNERAIRHRWPALVGLLDASLVELSALPSEPSSANTVAVRKYNLLQQLQIRTYCFFINYKLLFFAANDYQRIFVVELSQGQSLYTFQATKGDVMNLACDWIGERVFWTEVYDGQFAIYTRSYMNSRGPHSGVRLIAKLQAGSVIADLKFHALKNLLFWTASSANNEYALFYYNLSQFAELNAQKLEIECLGQKVKVGRSFCLRHPSFVSLQSASIEVQLLLVNVATRSTFLYNLQSKQCQTVLARTFDSCAFSGPDVFNFITDGQLHEAELNVSSRLVSRSAPLQQLSGHPNFEQSVLPSISCFTPSLLSDYPVDTTTKRQQSRSAPEVARLINLTIANSSNTSIHLQVDFSGVNALLNRLTLVPSPHCSRPLWTHPLFFQVRYNRVKKQRSSESELEKICIHDGFRPFDLRTINFELHGLIPSSNYALNIGVFWLHWDDAIVSVTKQIRTQNGIPSKPIIDMVSLRDFNSYNVYWQSERADHSDRNLQHAVLIRNASGFTRVEQVNCTIKALSCTAWFSVEESEKQLITVAVVSRNRMLTSTADISVDPLSSISNYVTKTFPAQSPPEIVPTEVKTREISVRWGCSRDDRYILMWAEKPNTTFTVVQLLEQLPPSNRHLFPSVCHGPVKVQIKNLKPATEYVLFGHMFLTAASTRIIWPASGLTVKTQPDVPDCTNVKVSVANDAFTIGWRTPANNGAPILRYQLMLREVNRHNNETAEWTHVQDVNATVSSLRLPVAEIYEFLSTQRSLNNQPQMPADGEPIRIMFALAAVNAVGFNQTCHNISDDTVHELTLPQVVLKSEHHLEVQQASHSLTLAIVVAVLSIIFLIIGGCVVLRRSRSLRIKAAERLHMPILLTNDDRFIISRAQQAKLLCSNHSISSVFGMSTRTPRADSNSIPSSVGSDVNSELSIVRLNTASKLVQLRFKPQLQTQAENLLYEPSMQALTKEALGDVSKLPRILREEIKLVKFLGSGAFGKVYEGLLTVTQLHPRKKPAVVDQQSGTNAAESSTADDAQQTSQIRVAIKKLRKNASNAEREEFLQEALLMMNFDHAHIVRLIGVCFEACSSVIIQCDSAQVSPWPEFIVLELMNDGDLLKYLRHARPNSSQPCQLDKFDLLGIIADIASGCSYLEALHFVHRDIATRNCLVHCDTNPDGSIRRVTKISDFGMARDIYRNDYYRKEGEGLLPVRWMSPEALIDGLFTTQSDVWAYGVLVWEVFTLGQQPYPARTNIEVLEYVRVGGRLDRPLNCPDEVFDILSSCWDASPRQRPTFSDIQSKITAFIDVAHKNQQFKRELHFDETDLARFIATAIDTQSGRFADVQDNALSAAFQKRSNTDALSQQKCDENILDDMSSSSFQAYLRNSNYFRRKGQVIASRSRSLSLSVRPRSTNSDCSHTELLRSSDRPSITSSYVTLSSKSAALDTQTVTTSLSSSKTVLQATGV